MGGYYGMKGQQTKSESIFSLIQALTPPTMPVEGEPHPVKKHTLFGGWVDPLRHPQIHGFLLPWVNHSKPPRRDSFPAFDVIHLGKCSRKILQEPKDQETVPTLNLGMHMKIRQVCIYELSPKQSLKFPLACLCFLKIISATVIPCWSWVLIKNRTQKAWARKCGLLHCYITGW